MTKHTGREHGLEPKRLLLLLLLLLLPLLLLLLLLLLLSLLLLLLVLSPDQEIVNTGSFLHSRCPMYM